MPYLFSGKRSIPNLWGTHFILTKLFREFHTKNLSVIVDNKFN
jgi:hypothetical protein